MENLNLQGRQRKSCNLLVRRRRDVMTHSVTGDVRKRINKKGRKPSAVQSRQNRFKNLARELQLDTPCGLLLSC